MSYKLHCGDCMTILPTLSDCCVDSIITDLPYGTTACAWDSVIPFAPMWEQVKRVLKPRGAFITTDSQPFTSALILSNIKWFKYCLVWDKQRGNDPQLANIRPMKQHEDIVIFCNGSPIYNPQMKRLSVPDNRSARGDGINRRDGSGLSILSGSVNYGSTTYTERYPTSIIAFENGNQNNKPHPTQKPVALYEYLINTYTNPGDVVLDFVMGSGTTVIAAIRTGRSAIGIERDPAYFAIAQRRIADAAAQPMLPGLTVTTPRPEQAEMEFSAAE